MKKYVIEAIIVCVLGPVFHCLSMNTNAQQRPVIKRVADSVLTVRCETVDTLFADQTNGGYLNNPFQLKATITNTTDVAYSDVEAVAISFTGGIKVVGNNPDILGDIAPHTSLQVTWDLVAMPHKEATDAKICVLVTADNHVTVECCSSVHLTAIPLPAIEGACKIEPSDTLRYNERTGWTGLPELRLKAVIGNRGQETAYRVRGTALLPGNMALQAGEVATKSLDPQDIPPNGSDSLVWKVMPGHIGIGSPGWVEFEVLVTSENGQPVRCRTRLYLEAFSHHVYASFPEYSFVRSGEQRNIPLHLGGAAGVGLSEYALLIHYHPAMLRINGVSTTGTLTELGWTATTVRNINDETVEISAKGGTLETEEGVLLNLQVEGVLERQLGAGSFGWSVLDIDTMRSTLNLGAISFSVGDGNVIVTDDCLEPLVHAGGSTLKQNRPNPFNPTTLIEYTLPEKEHIRLRVFDSHGRDVAVLVEGMQERGTHSVTFNAEQLPSGMYFYRLETPRGLETRKMVLMR